MNTNPSGNEPLGRKDGLHITCFLGLDSATDFLPVNPAVFARGREWRITTTTSALTKFRGFASDIITIAMSKFVGLSPKGSPELFRP